MTTLFQDRSLVIATKHAKERALAPVLEGALGVRCLVPDALDTDLLGTFTGEVERTLDPVAAAREKCRRAMDATGTELAVASEGSFGPHPVMVFVPGGEEILVFVDRANDLEVVVRDVSAATNFATAQLSDEEALLDFARKAQFPSHGLILRRSRDSDEAMHKAIHDEAQLLGVFRELCTRYGQVCIETDMRAQHNPTRMEAIAAAGRKLVARLEATCPQCARPGFAVTEVIRGLPCELCGLPTDGVSRHVLICAGCGQREEIRYPDGRTAQDPMYCEFCNP